MKERSPYSSGVVCLLAYIFLQSFGVVITPGPSSFFSLQFLLDFKRLDSPYTEITEIGIDLGYAEVER